MTHRHNTASQILVQYRPLTSHWRLELFRRSYTRSAVYAVARCLSVRPPSVTRRYCVETAQHDLKLLHRLVKVKVREFI